MAKPLPGDIWRYDYLWRWQHERGETEGRKRGPSAFVAVVKDHAGKTNLFILPLTSQPPGERLAIEVPQIEKRRAGLDDLRIWVMLDEYNHDLLESSFYFDPNARLGAFSGAFHRKVASAFLKAAKEKKIKRVPRG